MMWVVDNLWLIPVLPLLAAAILSIVPQRSRGVAATLSIGAMLASLGMSIAGFLLTLDKPATADIWRETRSFTWMQIGSSNLELGWVLDPLTAVMLVMVTFVGTLIFVYSIGYMAHDRSFTRFFCCLSLFAAAMLGIVISNSLLLTFVSWELVGLASYLLIGFWYHKPEAAAAAQKAFITTRIGDIGFFIGLLWLASSNGTLLFYDAGNGCLEQAAVTAMFAQTAVAGITVSTAISLLIFCGAVGKSGQVPLHTWLPDAMEGPTPVSALIHAATMVAAGVFLVARVYPLMEIDVGASWFPAPLTVVTWVGAITAVFAASIAVAQNDIKRILAYSTVSQLGYMMMGIGVGGPGVGMFHLITHAFFKALLFLGAGSVIHGCHEEQDIRKMGGLWKKMPVTFVTYAVGMMALSGVPIFFSGFWSKDAILHAAHSWDISHGPFYLGLLGAMLTAFYMTRQIVLVFFGNNRATGHDGHPAPVAHESPAVMTVPLVVLALSSIALGAIGTPAYPWFQEYIVGSEPVRHLRKLLQREFLELLAYSGGVVLIGIGLGWWLYFRKPRQDAGQMDNLQQRIPEVFSTLENKYYVDELYGKTVIAFNAWWAGVCDWMDRWIWGGVVAALKFGSIGLAWASKFFDEFVINLGFDQGCKQVTRGGWLSSKLQDGQVQDYLRALAVSLTVILLLLSWGCSK